MNVGIGEGTRNTNSDFCEVNVKALKYLLISSYQITLPPNLIVPKYLQMKKVAILFCESPGNSG